MLQFLAMLSLHARALQLGPFGPDPDCPDCAQGAELDSPYWDDRRVWNRAYNGTRDPLKVAARAAVRNAVLAGKLIRPGACAHCGAACRPAAHHPDYARPLDVVWLCG